jgi:hypothetical protein
MQRRSFLGAGALALAPVWAAPAMGRMSASAREAIAMARAAALAMQRRDWEQGVLAQAP